MPRGGGEHARQYPSGAFPLVAARTAPLGYYRASGLLHTPTDWGLACSALCPQAPNSSIKFKPQKTRRTRGKYLVKCHTSNQKTPQNLTCQIQKTYTDRGYLIISALCFRLTLINLIAQRSFQRANQCYPPPFSRNSLSCCEKAYSKVALIYSRLNKSVLP